MTTDIKALVYRVYETINAKDFAAMKELFAPHCISHALELEVLLLGEIEREKRHHEPSDLIQERAQPQVPVWNRQ